MNSANLSGYNLPLDRVAAASGRIDALAKAAKRAGDGRILDQIRADLFLGMTDGTYTGLDDAAIITLLTAAPTSNTDDSEPDDSGPASGEGAGDRSVPSNDVPVGLGRPGTGMELRVRLSTLLGHDQHPAELAGWGYLHAELARDLVGTLGQAQWHSRSPMHTGS
ncbi:MAG TPA: hypothetical protein VNA67_00745 [Pseudonocardiaceae bacterium]|nr:hypothetical protein [Pseudonocardiaceae bacterium]